MLCSVPATKSGSSWLDRLRSNKGFPSGDNLHLDDILKFNQTTNTNSSSEFPPANASAPTELTRPHYAGAGRVANRSVSSHPNPTGDNQGEAFLGLMSDALSELFFMDGADENSKLSGKKISRKQTNPRVCVNYTTNSNSDASNVDAANNENAVDNSSLMRNEKELKNVGSGGECEEAEMRGYSISEVTVIDTSCGVWKTDKVVFRRKNVWKVREKKAKVKSCWGHKRKVVNEEVGGESGGDIDKKKAKVSVSVSGLMEADHGDECVVLKSTEGQNSQNDTSKEVSKNTEDNPNDRREEFGEDMRDNKSKDIRKGRFPLNKSPRKLKKCVSSVKGIRTDNRNGGKLHRKSLKDGQEQRKLD